MKRPLNQLVPNRAVVPAYSLTAATSAPIGPAARVSPRWAKIDADQKLATPERARTAVEASRKVAHAPIASSAAFAGNRTVIAAATRAAVVSSPT